MFSFIFSKKFSAEVNQIAELLGIKKKSVIAEIGAGKGKMTIAIANRIDYDGHLYSVECNPRLLRKIKKSIWRAGLKNISSIQGSQDETYLPPNGCDGMFMRGVYHHFTDPKAMNRSFFKALKSGGLLLIIDFKPRLLLSLFSRPKGMPKNRGGHGIEPDVLIREVTEAGFEFIKKIDRWPNRMYALVFMKP